MTSPKYYLPQNMEHYLSLLAKYYAREGHKMLQQIIVDSTFKIEEAWSIDNWNGGTYGHALYLILPEALYLNVVKHKNKLQDEIKTEINKMHNIPNEFVEKVFFEAETSTDEDWRKESGVLMKSKRVVLPETINRIWGDGEYRVFISHKAEFKKEASELKTELGVYGISSFVAHEDVHPTKEWQDEIENALSSMDALVALLTDKFHDSNWTDQEIGFAFGVGVPIISIKLGKDPYGFIGKFQALSCSWDSTAKQIVELLLKHEGMLSAYIKAIKECNTYKSANTLSEMLPQIGTISPQQTKDIMIAFNSNDQIRDSFGFNGKKKSYGEGLAYHLSRLTGKNYHFSSTGEIEDMT